MRLSKPFIKNLENLVINTSYTPNERIETAGLATRLFLSGNTKSRPRRAFMRALEELAFDANATVDERMEAGALLVRLFTSGLAGNTKDNKHQKPRIDTSGLSELLANMKDA